jgi:hypothetical protein
MRSREAEAFDVTAQPPLCHLSFFDAGRTVVLPGTSSLERWQRGVIATLLMRKKHMSAFEQIRFHRLK